jgi:hypothetical protein
MRVRIRVKPDLSGLRKTTDGVLALRQLPERELTKAIQGNRKFALASASLLTPLALMPFGLSMWRLGADLGFGSFAIHSGVFSHWQVWLGVSGAVQCLAVVLNKYSRQEHQVLLIEPQAMADETTDIPVRRAKVLQFPAPGTAPRRIAQG